ncbi:hypothetical protein BD310DRAFT_558917 [Dichomitus squalens]|uniref:Uncharacterized protein n=1 Tax=Dichomitus squalens TaxID=114155 RepID=A0A4Q9PSP2_9APHY|nr:hypothetical protein BD310DRAFT_558917 [Dichomitus squalens]
MNRLLGPCLAATRSAQTRMSTQPGPLDRQAEYRATLVIQLRQRRPDHCGRNRWFFCRPSVTCLARDTPSLRHDNIPPLMTQRRGTALSVLFLVVTTREGPAWRRPDSVLHLTKLRLPRDVPTETRSRCRRSETRWSQPSCRTMQSVVVQHLGAFLCTSRARQQTRVTCSAAGEGL